MKRRLLLALAPLAVLAACADPAAPPVAADARPSLGRAAGDAGQPVPDQYIVVFRADASDASALARRLADAHGAAVHHTYRHAIKGFAGRMSAQAAAAIARHPSVSYVEPDRVRQISQVAPQSVPTGVRRIFADGNAEIGIDGADDLRVDADVAIIDTGIDFEHPDLNINVAGSRNCAGGGPFGGSCKSGGDDDHYHGTHVAGTAAALDNGAGVVGVAPGARLWAVKVLDSRGSGYTSWIIAGIDYVAENAAAIEVANMSLGGSGFSQGEYDAIQGAVSKGVAFAVAAGNSDADAANYSPAAFNNVLTVSALADGDGAPGGKGAPTCRADEDDTLADFSNWGTVVDIAAPGVCIHSTYPLERGEYGTISGTSMASPHVAGALALLASRRIYGDARDETDVRELYTTVTAAANTNQGWTDESGDGVHEPLLDVSNTTTYDPNMVEGTNSGGGTADGAPTASFTPDCNNLSCSFDGSASSDDIGISTYTWDLGDGTAAKSGATITHDYAEAGTYTVTLTVADGSNQADNESKSVTVSTCVRNRAGKCK